MQIEQSMNGSPPLVFTPGWSDGAGVGHWQDIPVESLSITRGVVASSAVSRQVTISGNIQRVVALTLEIGHQARAIATLSDIPFEVTGELGSEVIFNSERQNTPWNFLLKINSESRQMTLSFTLNYTGLSVDNALIGVTFYQALARGGEFRIRGRHQVTGGEVSLARGNLPPGTYEESDPRFLKLLEDLAFIQNKTGVSFTVPECNITFQDANTIAATAEILKTGHAKYPPQPWVSISKVEQAKNALESFAREKPIAMALHFEGEVVRIFGTHVPLGPVTLFCARSYITKNDLEALRRDLEVAAPGGYLSIQFTPFEECPIEARYIKWLPKDEAEAIKQLPMYMKSEQVVDEDGWTLPQINVDAAVALLKSWYEEDVDEQKQSWERLKVGLDEHRLSDRKLFQ
ncbi:MAG: hypothetical protein ACR2HX_21035 [Pyrinomonadaceae bacterium]